MPDFMRVDDDGIRQRVYTMLSTGYEVECLPVGQHLATVGSSVADPPKPAPPQYTIEGVGGAKEKRDHDEVSIKDPKTSDKERAAWDKYQERLEKWEAKVAENQAKRDTMEARFIALRAIAIPSRPTDEAMKQWAEEQELLFGLVPDSDNGLPDKINLYLFWIAQEVIATQDDGKRIMIGVMRASGMDAEAIDQAVNMFWPEMGNAGGSGTDDTRDPGASGQEEKKAG